LSETIVKTTMATTIPTATTKITTVILHSSTTRTPNAGIAKIKGTCKKIASPGNVTRPLWSMPTASRTSKTTASTTSLTSLPLPKLPATKTPFSGQSLILALAII
jgi:hypothetical protein